MGDGRFQKGFDPRRSPGGKPGPRKATIEYNQAKAKEAQERQQREAEIESNLTPLEYMLRRMRDTGMSEPERFAAARSSAQYMHPQLQAIASHRTHGHRNDRGGRSRARGASTHTGRAREERQGAVMFPSFLRNRKQDGQEG